MSGQESETGNSPEEQIEGARQSIVGAWRTAVTQRNCQTDLPLAPASRGLLTFNEGGTLSEYNAGPALSPAMRSPGHGVWLRLREREYSFVFIINRYDASGVFIGTTKIRAALELGASGNFFNDAAISASRNVFTTNAAVEIFDASDNLIGRGCATSVGTRIE
ncbi:MAG: hypothetical protein H0U96_06665 [Acidobacteria bacterium]|nr:hypothetical protein [Acidobacteriota bacterium]